NRRVHRCCPPSRPSRSGHCLDRSSTRRDLSAALLLHRLRSTSRPLLPPSMLSAWDLHALFRPYCHSWLDAQLPDAESDRIEITYSDLGGALLDQGPMRRPLPGSSPKPVRCRKCGRSVHGCAELARDAHLAGGGPVWTPHRIKPGPHHGSHYSPL